MAAGTGAGPGPAAGGTAAALAAGLIDERRAEVITSELAGLDDEHAAAVEELLIGKAPGLTSEPAAGAGPLLLISADPAAARRRKEAALKDARVEAFTEPAGTAGLSGRDPCPADVLAADRYLTGLAQAMKAAGITGSTDTLRAHAYLHLLSGQPAATLLDPAPRPPSGGPASGNGGHPGGPGPGNPGGPGIPGPGLRGTVHLTMPLTAWLGWTQSPGEAARFGPLDAADSRALAGLLARRSRQPLVRHPHQPQRAPRRPRLHTSTDPRHPPHPGGSHPGRQPSP